MLHLLTTVGSVGTHHHHKCSHHLSLTTADLKYRVERTVTEPLAWCPGLEREVVFTVYSSRLASTCSSTYYTAALSNTLHSGTK